MTSSEGTRAYRPPGCDPHRNGSHPPYLYQQPLERQPASPEPERLRLLLDELRQARRNQEDLQREVGELKLRLAEAEAAQRALDDELRRWRQQGLHWRKRLRQTEGLLKRVLKRYRELARQSREKELEIP